MIILLFVIWNVCLIFFLIKLLLDVVLGCLVFELFESKVSIFFLLNFVMWFKLEV